MNSKNQVIETGSFHILINEWHLDIRGIFYVKCAHKVFVRMPEKKGVLDGEKCEFPIINFRNKNDQKIFVKNLGIEFGKFMKTPKYKSYERAGKAEKIEKAKKKMNFITLS